MGERIPGKILNSKEFIRFLSSMWNNHLTSKTDKIDYVPGACFRVKCNTLFEGRT